MLAALSMSCFFLNGVANAPRLIQHTYRAIKLQINIKGQIKASKCNPFVGIVAFFFTVGDKSFYCVNNHG